MSSPVALAITAVLILLNGVFVAAEFGLIAARRTRIEALAEAGDRRARLSITAMSDLPLTLAGAQLGITVTSLGLGLIAEPALAHLIEPVIESVVDVPSGVVHAVGFGTALFLVVLAHMVLGEMVPKNLALSDAERTVRAVVPVHWVFVAAFRPVIWVLNGMAALILKPFGIEQVDELGTAHTAQELVTMIDASRHEGFIDDARHGLLSGALDFRERTVESVMVPWAQVSTVPRDATVAQVSAIAAANGHSRLPVLAADAVLGFVHVKDLLYVDDDALDRPMSGVLIRRMLVVPADRSLESLLFAMRRAQVHVALVRADGARVGLVTLEDVLESIVGDIIDETDRIRGVARTR